MSSALAPSARRSAHLAIIAVALAAGLLALAPVAPASAAVDDFFPSDPNTLAVFEFNGDVLDSSGNGRDATLLNPGSTYLPTTFGQGLALPALSDVLQGVEWNAHKALLVPPYTVEVLVYPEDLGSWKRLFTHDPDSDNGLYYYLGSLVNYPDPPLDGVSLPVAELHCLAWSAPASPANTLDLYLDGEYLGQVNRTYDEPTVAWFFQDDINGAPNENIAGYVDAMRISNIARTGTELAATCDAANAGVPLGTPGPPTAMAAAPGDNLVALNWTAPASDGGSPITDYVIEYKATSSGTWLSFADGTSTATNATVTGLVNGVAYDFRVSAVNDVGAGPASATVSATSGVLADSGYGGADSAVLSAALVLAGAALLLSRDRLRAQR